MRFLRSLQKQEAEQSTPIVVNRTRAGLNSGTDAPEIFTNGKLKIGSPVDKIEQPIETVLEVAIPEATQSNGIKTQKGGPTLAKTETLRRFAVEPTNVNERLVAITQPSSTYCEEYRSLRTNLIHKSQEKCLRSIVIASIRPSEGKTITALNLAWLLAQTDGIKALIIDGDLRRPSISEYLGLETGLGLSDIVAGDSSLKEASIHLDPVGLCLLPAGQPRTDIAELLSGPRFGGLLEEAYSEYDFVIIDAPPLSLFADAALLINKADGALLVVRSGHTPYKEVERVMNSLPHESFLGVVLNQSDDVLANKRYYEYPYYKQR